MAPASERPNAPNDRNYHHQRPPDHGSAPFAVQNLRLRGLQRVAFGRERLSGQDPGDKRMAAPYLDKLALTDKTTIVLEKQLRARSGRRPRASPIRWCFCRARCSTSGPWRAGCGWRASPRITRPGTQCRCRAHMTQRLPGRADRAARRRRFGNARVLGSRHPSQISGVRLRKSLESSADRILSIRPALGQSFS
jgi:hypothetical protein